MKKQIKNQIIFFAIAALCTNSATYAIQQECRQVQKIYKKQYIAQKVEVDGVVKKIVYGYKDIPVFETVCTPINKSRTVVTQDEQYYAPKKAKKTTNLNKTNINSLDND